MNSQEPQTVVIHSERPTPSHTLRRSFPDMLRTRALYERRQDRLVAAGIICDDAHDLLKRSDSAPMGVDPSDCFVKADYTSSLSATSVMLKPGHNTVQVMMKVGESCSAVVLGALVSLDMGTLVSLNMVPC